MHFKSYHRLIYPYSYVSEITKIFCLFLRSTYWPTLIAEWEVVRPCIACVFYYISIYSRDLLVPFLHKTQKKEQKSHKIIIKICILFGQAVLFRTTNCGYTYCTQVDQNLFGWACVHSPTNFFQGVFQLNFIPVYMSKEHYSLNKVDIFQVNYSDRS